MIYIFFLISILNSKIFTIYSDVGVSTDVYTWTDGGYFDGNFTPSTVAEGYKCFKTTCSGSYAGWGVIYSVAQNFSDYSGGDLRFWIYSSTGKIKVELEEWSGTKGTKYITQYGWSDSNIYEWKLINIPLNDFGVNVANIKSPFEITTEAPSTFYVDLARWTTGVALPDTQIKIKRISDNVEVTSITWNSVILPANWSVADCYIDLEVDIDTTTWGIQIYTNNKSVDANPRYTGTSNPVGVVDTTTTTKVLPMSWTIEDTTKTLSSLGTSQPDTWVTDGNMWKWMKDKDTSGFENGENYVTLWRNQGILYDGLNRAWKNSPNYIYFGANFSNAVTPRSYKTNQLKIELYYE